MSTTNGAERVVIGALLAEWPEELPSALKRILRFAPDSFSDPKLGALAVAMRELHAKGKFVSTTTLEQTGKWSSIELGPLIQDNCGPTLLDDQAREQWKAYRGRRKRDIHAEAAQAITEHLDQADSISAKAEDALAYLGEDEDKKEWFRFYTPSELESYDPPAGMVLVGDHHIVRGNVTVIAGCPGVGKSRAGTALAKAGALGQSWFGLDVHRRFRTAIIQCENGRHRLKQEFTGPQGLDGWIASP